VAFKNAVTDGQAQADTATCFFGGKKWLKDAREDFGRNARPVIPYHNADMVGFMAEAGYDPKVSTLRHGVESVHDQREDDLLDLGSVAIDRRQIGIELRLHLNAREIELVLDQAQRSVYDLIEIGRL
jgi:hypothetical protein